jgi:hypothetical protein
VMISQNRADAKREVLANQEWKMVQGEDSQNRELLRLSNEILELTKAVHAFAAARSEADGLVIARTLEVRSDPTDPRNPR